MEETQKKGTVSRNLERLRVDPTAEVVGALCEWLLGNPAFRRSAHALATEWPLLRAGGHGTDELVNDTVTRLLVEDPRFAAEAQSRKDLFVIAFTKLRRLAADLMRSMTAQKRRPPGGLAPLDEQSAAVAGPPADQPPAAAEAAESLRRLAAALEVLRLNDEALHQFLCDRFFEGLTFDEIVRKRGGTSNGVRYQVAKGVAFVRQELGGDHVAR